MQSKAKLSVSFGASISICGENECFFLIKILIKEKEYSYNFSISLI